MNVDKAAELANAINPKTVVPMHFEIKRSKELEQFKQLLNSDITLKIMCSNHEK